MTTLTMILSSFECNKQCPYCTSKITNWPAIYGDDFFKLYDIFKSFDKQNKHFDSFVLSGNGEPSIYQTKQLSYITCLIKEFEHLFSNFRLQTSGFIFYNERKLKLFTDMNFLFKITRVSPYFDIDSKTLNYINDYTTIDAYNNVRLQINHVLLKSNINTLCADIEKYLNTYKNIESINLSILNTNTKDSNIDNIYSKWIIENGILKENVQQVYDVFDKNSQYINTDIENIKLYANSDVPIKLYDRRCTYGIDDTVIYGGQLTDYSLSNFNKD